MRSHDRRRDETGTSAPKAPAPEAAGANPFELAGTIGNSAMQRVAESPELQRSPAAAVLGPTIARQSEEEELAVDPGGGGEMEQEPGAGAEMVQEPAAGEQPPELEEPE